MTSKLVVNTIEADTGISSVSFASSISMSSTSKFHFSDAGIDIGADTNINRPAAGVLGFNINGAEKVRIDSSGHMHGVGVVTATHFYGNGANLTGITQTTINGNADNRIITGSGTANTLEAESTLTYDGTNLDLGDAKKIRLGDSQDLELFHNGANSGIINSQGALYITNDATNSSDVHIRGKSSIKLHCPADGDVRIFIKSNGDIGFNDTSPTAHASGNNTVLSIKGKGSSYSGKIDFKDSSGNLDNYINSDNAVLQLYCDPNSTNGNTAMQFFVYGGERLRIGRHGQIGLAGANYGTARQVMVSNGSGSAVTWSSNPFLLDMDSLGDLDYDGVFLRYRETGNITGNGLVHLGLCKSTTNCSPGRIGIPVGFIPGTSYNSHFRVDKVGITPWPDGSGHRYEFYAIISDYVSAGKLGIFYLTNSTN